MPSSFAPRLASAPVLVFSALLALPTTPAPAAEGHTAYLVRDLRPSNSSFEQHAEPSQLTILGNKAVFLAQEPSSGQEVWVSDGSSGGTEMLTDLCPGPCSSKSRILGTLRGLVYWVGEPEDDSYNSPLQLWRSDGTRAGTFSLNDPGTHSLLDQEPETYALTSRHLYFTACAPDVTNCAIWRTDGTAAGTVRVTEFGYDDPFDSGPSSLAVLGDTLIFYASDGL
ncbi:MAG TPA: hypothetical protein VL025_16200, partial [Thermoanaerobaculia bacterium]|nr:hypothetical protein [Thermoanaerobaculia bacterium]